MNILAAAKVNDCCKKVMIYQAKSHCEQHIYNQVINESTIKHDPVFGTRFELLY